MPRISNFINTTLQSRAKQLKQAENSSKNEAVVPYNISNPAFPVVKEITKDQNGQDSLSGSIKGMFIFDLGLKSIGLAYSKIKSLITHVKPENPVKLVDRFFTPNALGLELGKNAAIEACGKKIPTLLKNPLSTFKQTFSKVAGESVSGRSLLKFSGATSWIIMGLVCSIGDIVKAFKQGPIAGFKQLGKTVVNQAIYAGSFISGEYLGSMIGAAIGGIAKGKVGAKIGAWAGGLAGGCAASFFADKHISTPLGLTSKSEDKKAATQQAPKAAAPKVPEIQDKKSLYV